MWQDSSYADEENMRSRTLFIAMMCGGPIMWGSKLQPTMALYTVEAEYMAVNAASHDVLLSVNSLLISKLCQKIPHACWRITVHA